MAKSFKITVTSKSALNIGGRKPYGHFLETLDFIPGSVMRGAFAKLMMETDKQLFDKLFKTSVEVIRFTDLYPTAELPGSDLPLVLPMTAVSCKYEPGFCTGYDKIDKDEDKPPHGIFDILIHELIFDQSGDKLPFAFQPRCPKCGKRVEPISGYYDSSADYEDRTSEYCRSVDNEYYTIKSKCMKGSCPRSYEKAEPKSQRMTKVAINRSREVSQDELLYSVESMRQEQGFVGIVTLLDDSLSAHIEKKLGETEGIRLGGGVSRGFGQVDIQVNNYDKVDSPEDIKCRIDSFNSKIKELADYYQVFASGPMNPGNGYFTIDFQSDAIIFDDIYRNTAKFTAEKLIKSLGIADIKLKAYCSRMAERGGWSFAWNLPKEKEQVLEKGSVFLYQCSDVDKLYESLFRLQMNGIGEKREEGLGRIIVCNPFHEEVYCS